MAQGDAVYAENALTIPINQSSLQLVAGIRSEITAINGSEYGNIANWSPRVNAKYTFWERKNQLVSDLNVKLAWGKTVKLPGFDALYSTPNFIDIRTFTPGTTDEGHTFYGYYTIPRRRVFNPDLKWQSNEQREIAISATIAGNRIYLTASQDKTTNPYDYSTLYDPFYFNFTTQVHLNASTIPVENRIYAVNQQTGIVTVTDKTGAIPTENLEYDQRYQFMPSTLYTNGSPVKRSRLTWTVDFKQIRSLKTSFRVDGNYYYYKGLEEQLKGFIPNPSQLMANGQYYKFIGFYLGGANASNGSITKSMDMNFTVTTHIPAIRLILSARLESSFYTLSQNLSEKNAGQRGFVLDSRDAYEPSNTQSNIYGGDRFVGLYPEYYISLDDLSTKIPFAEKFLWAKTNDPALYN
ncbi:MAG: TonB-dependent receptor, partial [Pedobacter sp.]